MNNPFDDYFDDFDLSGTLGDATEGTRIHDQVIHPMAQRFVTFIAEMEPEEYPEIAPYMAQMLSCVARELLVQIFDEVFELNYDVEVSILGIDPDHEHALRNSIIQAMTFCAYAAYTLAAYDADQIGGFPAEHPLALWKL